MGLEGFRKHVEDVNKLFEDEIYKSIKEFYRKKANKSQERTLANSAANYLLKISVMESLYTSMLNDLNTNPYKLCSNDIENYYGKWDIMINDAINGLQTLNGIIRDIMESGQGGSSMEEFASKLRPLYEEYSFSKEITLAISELNKLKRKGVPKETLIKDKKPVISPEYMDYMYMREKAQFENYNNVDHNEFGESYEESHEVSIIPTFDDNGHIVDADEQEKIQEENKVQVKDNKEEPYSDRSSEMGELGKPVVEDKKLAKTQVEVGDDRLPYGHQNLADINTVGVFKKYIDKLEAAKTGYNSGEYGDIIKYLKKINTEPGPYDNMVNRYAAKLLAARQRIDKYISHKAKQGVKQNAYKKLAAVEEVCREIDKRIRDLIPYAANQNNQQLVEVLVARDVKNKLGYQSEFADPITAGELKDKCLAAKAKGIAKEDIADLKLADDCMVRIIVSAHTENSSDKTIASLEDMRTQFQNNPSKRVAVATETNEKVKADEPQQLSM